MISEVSSGTIEVNHLVKNYGNGKGVFDISFKVLKGECLGFIGPNGAGKSTTIRLLLGFSSPDKGECFINGHCISKNDSSYLKDVGYLPGEICLPKSITGIDFLRMQSKLKGINNREFLEFLIKKFNVNVDIYCGDMSFGMKRRLAIVNCFLSNPDILIFDEPTSGLDLTMQQVFIEHVKQEKIKGKTILFSSHIFSEINDLCNKYIIIKNGKIIDSKDKTLQKSNEKKIFDISFKSNIDYQNALLKRKWLTISNAKKDLMQARFEFRNEYLSEFFSLLSRYDIISISEYKDDLESNFLSLYNSGKVATGYE